jgi:hypothetical protein
MPLIRLWQLVTPLSGAWPDSTHLMRLISATPSTPKPTLGSDSPGRRLVFALQLTTPTLPFPTSQPQVPACPPVRCIRVQRNRLPSRCLKGDQKLAIREDGTVLPEVPNLSHEFALGNIQDGPLSVLVTWVFLTKTYFDDGYSKFDSLCRTAYGEILPTWDWRYCSLGANLGRTKPSLDCGTE